MDNITICYGFSNMVVFHPNQIMSFWEIMSIVGFKASNAFACFWLIKSNIQRTFSYCEATMNVPRSTEFTAFMTNVKF
jgi:hypothetical protein